MRIAGRARAGKRGNLLRYGRLTKRDIDVESGDEESIVVDYIEYDVDHRFAAT